MSTTDQTKQLLQILETLPSAVFVLDDTDTIVYANASAQAITGTTPGEVVGTSWWSGAPHLVSAALYQAVQWAKQTREPTDVAYISPITQQWLHVHLAPTKEGLTLLFQQERAPAQRQETLLSRERHAVAVLNDVRIRFALLTPEGILLEINETPLDQAHIRREEVIGKPFAEAPWWSSDPASQKLLRAAIKHANTGETVRFEAPVRPREGMVLYIEHVITPHMDADHHIAYLIIAGIDITARKHAEAEIHVLIDAIPQLVWTGRPDGSVDFYNQRWRDYTGLSTEEAQGEGWMQCTHPDDRQRVLAVWQNAVQTGGLYETEQRLRQSTTGTYRWFLMQAVPYKDAQGTILKYIGTGTDIDEQKRAEERIKVSEQNWRMLAEAVPQLVWTMQPDGRLEYVNQRYSDWMQPDFELSGDDFWRQFVHPADIERTLALRRHSLETGEPYENEYRLKNRQTGTYHWFLTRGLPVRNEAGQIIKWFGTSTDIEDQKRAEQQLKESRESLRMLAETVPQLVWVRRPDSRHEYVNQRWCDYTGLTLEHVQSDRWEYLKVIHPDDRESNRAHWQHALETGDMFEYEERLRNAQTGEYRWFLVRALPVRDEGGHIVKWFGTSTDIEDQKRLEEALRQSQERVNVLMNSRIIGTFLAEDELIVGANDTYLRMTGYSREDLCAGRINWMQMTPPEYLARTQQELQELAVHQYGTPYEKEYICQDGSRLPVLVGVVALRLDPLYTIGFVLDNSARKELEQRKDDFIAVASHELRAPLTALKLQAALLKKRLGRQSMQKSAADLEQIEIQVNNGVRLMEELLDVSRIQTGGLKYAQKSVDLGALLREIVETMQQTCPTHTLILHGATQTMFVSDRDRLRQIFINLINNAIKYSPQAKTVEIDLRTTAETVTISVHDHGLGIPPEQREKIFERFYRAAGAREHAIPGLGIGLYLVAEIVSHYGGTITVDSQVGHGSTFHVTFPRTSQA